jgi:hypothetical protein
LGCDKPAYQESASWKASLVSNETSFVKEVN